MAAETAQAAAQASATTASTAATNAGTSATAAASSASSASSSASSATSSASTATTQASNASTSATNAANSASSASGSATTATTQATNASTSASTATTQATNASNSATTASTQATNAAASASSASTSATNAASSATSASGSASTATTQASNAASSASAASTSASNASTSATNASNSASAASTSASNAATSATNASNSASAASTSATNASNAQTAAEAARDATLTAYDNFDDRYLGSKTSDPTLDNDGNALVGGALYFNSVSGVMKVYTGSAWVAAYVSGADYLAKANNLSDLTNTATARTNLGLAIGTNVQAYDADLATIAGLTPTNNYAIIGNGTSWTSSALPASGVTSVTGTAPISSSGGSTPAISLASGYGDTQNPYASKTANYVLASPNGSSGVPTFRALVAADVPTLNQNTTGSAATLTTGRTISISGDLTYTSPSFNGSSNVTAAGTLATVNSNTGSFGSSSSIPVITVNGKGLVTAVSTATVAGGQYFGSAAVKAIAYNASNIDENITMTYNGMSVGAITIGSGYSVTVNAGVRWVIL